MDEELKAELERRELMAPDTYRVGLATTDITPPVGIKLSGFAARTEPSTGIYRSLEATAIAIDDGATPFVLLCADWLGFYDRAPMMRARLREAIGLPEERYILCGSHTHCGPCIREQDERRFGPLDYDYLERAVSAMAECATRAWKSRSEARLRFGSGACTFAASRRKPDGKGGVEWKPSLDAPHDHEVPVLAIETPAGELRGLIFSYACHPTSRGGLLIGPDYPGFARDYLARRFPGVTTAFIQGCGADQKPYAIAPQSGGFRSLEVDEVRALGDQLGAAVARVREQGEMRPVEGPIALAQRILELRTELMDLELVQRSLSDGREFVREWARYLLDRMDAGDPVVPLVPFEIETVRFGRSLAMVALAGEITVEHGLRLKRELRPRFENVLVAGYTNGVVGYVPVRRQIPEGGYEVWFAQQYHRRTGPFVPETEDQVHAAIHEALGEA